MIPSYGLDGKDVKVNKPVDKWILAGCFRVTGCACDQLIPGWGVRDSRVVPLQQVAIFPSVECQNLWGGVAKFAANAD